MQHLPPRFNHSVVYCSSAGSIENIPTAILEKPCIYTFADYDISNAGVKLDFDDSRNLSARFLKSNTSTKKQQLYFHYHFVFFCLVPLTLPVQIL